MSEPFNLDHSPKDVIANGMTLLDETIQLNIKQEQAVLDGAKFIGERFGGDAKVDDFKLREDGTLLIAYTLKQKPVDKPTGFIRDGDTFPTTFVEPDVITTQS